MISSVCNACTLAASWVTPCVLDIQLALFYCTSRGYFLLEADIFILKQVMYRIHAILRHALCSLSFTGTRCTEMLF